MVVCPDLEMISTTFNIVFKILGLLRLHDAKHCWSAERFIHHPNVSSHADISCQVDRDLANPVKPV